MANIVTSTLLAFLVLAGMTSQSADAVGAKKNGRIKTELWTGGDDGLTQEFSVALRKAIARSKDFELRNGASKYNFRMTIPSNIYWKTGQNKTNFHAVVVFTRGEKYLGITTSPCWEDEMKSCAEWVLAEARTSLKYEFMKPKIEIRRAMQN